MTAAKILTLLASPKNQRILNHLAAEPAHTKAIAQALGMGDSEVSRSLRAMESVGLLRGQWTRLPGGSDGKETNVKLYRLSVRGLDVGFGPEGLSVKPESDTPQPRLLVPAYHFAPPESVLFVGRADVLGAVRPDDRIVVLQGIPGVGKSSIAAEMARGIGRHVLWHNANPSDTQRRILNKIGVFLSGWGRDGLLESVQSGVEDEDALVNQVLDGLDRDEFLLVLDNYHEVADEAAVRLVHAILARAQRMRIVVTTRRQPRFIPPEQSVRVLEVEGFSAEDAKRFLEEKGLAVDDSLAKRIHARFGGHPLFLNFFAETVKAGRRPVADFFDEVPENELENYLWDELWSRLEDKEKLALEFASVLPMQFPKQALEAIHPDPKLPHTLFALERKLLLTRMGTLYGMHEVVRDFAYGKLADRKGAHGRAAKYHEEQGTPESRVHAMIAWHRAGQRKEVARLLQENVDLASFDVMQEGLHLLYEEVLESFEEPELPPRLWTNVLDDRGDLLLKRGDPGAAKDLYRSVLARARAANEAARVADVLWKLSLAHAQLGEAAEARKSVEDGLLACPDEAPETRERLEAQAERLKSRRGG